MVYMSNNTEANFTEQIAKLISLILDPRVLIAPTAIAVSLKASKSVIISLTWVLLLFLLTAFPIICIIFFKTKKGVFTDNQVSNKIQRNNLYLISFIGIAVTLLIMILNKGPKYLITMLVAMFFSSLFAGILNKIIKVSVHMGAYVGAVVSLIASWGIKVLPLLLFIPLVGWSRIVLRRHTLTEVIIGGTIGLTITSLTFLLLLPFIN